MNIHAFEAAFGAADRTSRAMRAAIADWFSLYYQRAADDSADPCQRIAYTVVSKLSRAVFGEYRADAEDPVVKRWLAALADVQRQALELALIGGECYLKPVVEGEGFRFLPIRRSDILIFARDSRGVPTDIGLMERSQDSRYFYRLLERRRVDAQGYLTIESKLYRSYSEGQLGEQIPLGSRYPDLAEKFTFPAPVGSVGLVQIRTPMVNCVDGSPDGVAVFAPAAGLIRAIDRNEAELSGEFSRGRSRILVSADMLDGGRLTDSVFVGLDEDPETAGVTIFAPQLREQSYLARKQEYLRNVESVIGLKRGMLSDSNVEERTATEITASNADFSLTVMDLQHMWQRAVGQTLALCAVLAAQYRLPVPERTDAALDFGNGVLYDEDAAFERNLQLVREGLLRPELALGWRFGMKTESEADRAAVRTRLMPETV